MSVIQEAFRKINVTCDYDGSIAPAFISSPSSALWLIRRQLSLPPENSPVGTYNPIKPLPCWPSEQVSNAVHRRRLLDQEAIEALKDIRASAEFSDRAVGIHVLTGRQPDKHMFTRNGIGRSGVSYLFDSVLQNPGANSAAFKEREVRRLIAEGGVVLHIEDDIRTAFILDRINAPSRDNPSVHIMLKNTVWNHPWLRKWAGIALPRTITPFSSFYSVADKFNELLFET